MAKNSLKLVLFFDDSIRMGKRILMVLSVLFIWGEILAEIPKDISLSDLAVVPLADSENYEMLRKKTEKRIWMLKMHKYTAYAALAAMTGAMMTAEDEGEISDEHLIWGVASGALYYTAASFALFAPTFDEKTEEERSLNWHERLAWVHGPAMLLAPILGYIAHQKYKNHETLTGIEKQHRGIASLGYLSFLAAAITISFDF